jgi:Zn finger protein HypA/HybF involved in hydrogenase expression
MNDYPLRKVTVTLGKPAVAKIDSARHWTVQLRAESLELAEHAAINNAHRIFAHRYGAGHPMLSKRLYIGASRDLAEPISQEAQDEQTPAGDGDPCPHCRSMNIAVHSEDGSGFTLEPYHGAEAECHDCGRSFVIKIDWVEEEPPADEISGCRTCGREVYERDEYACPNCDSADDAITSVNEQTLREIYDMADGVSNDQLAALRDLVSEFVNADKASKYYYRVNIEEGTNIMPAGDGFNYETMVEAMQEAEDYQTPVFISLYTKLPSGLSSWLTDFDKEGRPLRSFVEKPAEEDQIDTHCPDCDGLGEPLGDRDTDELSRCGNCKGWFA